MRVVVTGATGNVGTAVCRLLSGEAAVGSILGLARRVPGRASGKTEWASVDVRVDDLAGVFRGADVVVHLAWLIQPTHQPMVTWQANVEGSARVLRAVAEAKVPAIVYASSVGAYSPHPNDEPVSEDWPTDGWPAAAYTREKAYVERLLDIFEEEYPDRRVVRMRPSFIFQRSAASAQRRLFMGPLLPNQLVRPNLIPLLPLPRGLRFQAVHADDVAQAFGAAILGDAVGAFNIAADPVIDGARLGELLGARIVDMPQRLVRAAVATGWRLRAIPADPDLFDAFLRLPLLDATRARSELGWVPRHSSLAALEELLAGIREASGGDTPTLAAHAGGRWRIEEFRSGVGGSDPVDMRVQAR